jgi:ribonuclease BN (tRNA processing enzyme)
MKITFYGTRGGFPVGGQMSCARVETSDGAFVIDLGSTRLFEDPVVVAETDHVLLTHLHPDHIAHLAGLILARLNTPEAGGDCLFVAPESIQDYMDFSELGQVPGWKQTADVPQTWCGVSLEAMLTNHPKKNFAYKMTDETGTVVWTGDCSYSVELADFCKGADVVVCESTLREDSVENAGPWGHMTPSLFARLMNEAAPIKAVATHFTELPPEVFAGEVQRRLNHGIELVVAVEGASLDLGA